MQVGGERANLFSSLACSALAKHRANWQARTYSQAGSRSRGFHRMIMNKMSVKPDYVQLPVKHEDGEVMRRWAVLSPIKVAQTLPKVIWETGGGH
jgi:hypothetical protein